MKFTAAAAVGLLAAPAALANPLHSIFGRAVGDVCSGPNTLKEGTCKDKYQCKGISHPEPYCSDDPEPIQCCVEIGCHDDKFNPGVCRSVSQGGCLTGEFYKGNSTAWPCIGDEDIQCCIDSSGHGEEPAAPHLPGEPAPVVPASYEPGSGSGGSGGGAGGPPPKSLGQKIVDLARGQEGKDYAWGGGDCAGPTIGKYGNFGFDCSGLVAYALCNATGGTQDLFTKGLRDTAGFWCKSGIEKVAYSAKQPGDAVMFGTNAPKCSCDPEQVDHMGIVASDTQMWNAPTFGEPVQLADIHEKKRCDHVLRFKEVANV